MQFDSDWTSVRLGDVCEKVGSGATPRGGKETYVEEGVALIRSQNVYNHGFDRSGLAFITDKQAAKLDNVEVEDGDVLLNITGASVARCCLAPARVLPARVNQHVAIIRPEPSVLDRRFLRYHLIAPNTQGHLLALAGAGATREALTKGMIEALDVPLPPLDEQRRIAAVLGALDDRIEVNRRMNRTLEAMAQALFRSRFVDFDGRDDLVESEAGPIPSGWAVKPVGEVVDVVGGSTPSTKNPAFWEGGSFHWTTPKDLSSVSVPVLLDTERKITQAGLAKISSGQLPVGTVLMSSRAPVGYLAIAEVPLAVNQGYVAIPPQEGMSNLYVLFWLQANMDRVKARAGGTTFQEISKRNFRPIPMAVPPADVLAEFDATARPMYERIVTNERHSRTLAALRDALLPKLVSGELRVPEAEEAAEAVM